MATKLRGPLALAAAVVCVVAVGFAASAAPETGSQTPSTTTTAVDRRPLAVPPGTPTTTTEATTTTTAASTSTTADGTTTTVETTTTTEATTTTTAATTTTADTTTTTTPVASTVDVAKTHASTGDVHIRTLDGLVFDFQEVGDYVAVQSPDYTLQARQSPYAKKADVSINTGVAMAVGTDTVEFAQDPADSLWVNGKQVDFPTKAYELPGGGQIVPNGDKKLDVIVVLPTGERAVRVVMQRSTFIDYSGVRVGEGTYAGLLGNHDGDRENDLRTQGGQAIDAPATIEQVKAWGDSWLVPEGESLFRAPNPAKPAAEAKLITTDDLPEADVAAAESTCSDAGITDPLASQSCIYDIAATGDDAFVASAELVQESQEELPQEDQVLTQGIGSEGGGLSLPLLAGIAVVVLVLIALMFRFATKKPAAAAGAGGPAPAPEPAPAAAAAAAPASAPRAAEPAPAAIADAPTTVTPAAVAAPVDDEILSDEPVGDDAATGEPEIVTWDELDLPEDPDAVDPDAPTAEAELDVDEVEDADEEAADPEAATDDPDPEAEADPEASDGTEPEPTDDDPDATPSS